VALVIYVAVHCVLTAWKLDTDRINEVMKANDDAKKANAEREKMELRIYDGRPLFILKVMAQPTWQINKPVGREICRLKNCGDRTARWVRMEAVESTQGKHRLGFAELPALQSGEESSVGYCINDTGMDERWLCEFIDDHGPDSALLWWDVHIRFRDADESVGKEIVRLCFDTQSRAFYATGVPYTERGFKQPE
jgi:hypothetical protein